MVLSNQTKNPATKYMDSQNIIEDIIPVNISKTGAVPMRKIWGADERRQNW